MKTMKAVIIDDESNSRNSLRRKLATHCPSILVIAEAEAENAEQGIAMIEKNSPDIVFLDVEMPRMNGFGMLRQLKQRNFELIFTTAYDQYAIQAIRFSALDYLVKPIETSLLKEAVERAIEKRQVDSANQRLENLLHNLVDEKNTNNRIAIPSMEELQFINITDIVYLEAESNYTFIHLSSAPKITVSKTLKEFEELLPPYRFIRIHHSFIINKDHINKYLKGDGGQVLMSNGSLLDVSRRKKEEFMKIIGH